jgi:hypothetical protein
MFSCYSRHFCPILLQTVMYQHILVELETIKFHENSFRGTVIISCVPTEEGVNETI